MSVRKSKQLKNLKSVIFENSGVLQPEYDLGLSPKFITSWSVHYILSYHENREKNKQTDKPTHAKT